VSRPVFSTVRLKRRSAASNGSFSFTRTVVIRGILPDWTRESGIIAVHSMLSTAMCTQPSELRVLGIETSCDETGVALYSTERGLLAHTLHSQIALHAQYGAWCLSSPRATTCGGCSRWFAPPSTRRAPAARHRRDRLYRGPGPGRGVAGRRLLRAGAGICARCASPGHTSP